MKKLAALALTVLFAVFGFWLAEGAFPVWAWVSMAGAIVGCLAVAFMTPGQPRLKVFAGVAALALYIVAFIGGSISFTRAFNECVESSEQVRVQLNEYHQREKRYPERLSQLQNSNVCGRLVRPSLLEYRRTDSGYVLSFRDWLVEHVATESEPFMAHK